jgi:hypothetical protein
VNTPVPTSATTKPAGNQLPKFWWKIASDQRVGQKKKQASGIPAQFPCYGFFGYSFEIADTDELQPYAIRVCTSNLYKIGKGQNPSGILAICRSPKCIRAQSIGRKRPNSTPVCSGRHREGQRRCNGDELQLRVGILCGFNPFSISTTDYQGPDSCSCLDNFCGQ